MKPIRLLLPTSGQPRVELISSLFPKIMLTWEVLRKTVRYLDFSIEREKELSWVGKVRLLDFQNIRCYLIEDIIALKQRSSSTRTVIDPVVLGQIAFKWLEESGGKINPLKFWGHSHLFDSTEPSCVDDTQMYDFIRENATPDFFIRGIFSPQGASLQTALKAEFSLFDYKGGVVYRNVPWELADEYGKEELEKLLSSQQEEDEGSAYASFSEIHWYKARRIFFDEGF